MIDVNTSINTILQPISADLRLDCELLIAASLDKPRSFIYAHPEYILTDDEFRQFEKKWERRKAGEPLAYILGEKEFWGLTFVVNQQTLIPRPETEVLVETVLERITSTTCRFIDIGTGSGAIACAIASERPNWQITATDFDPKTLTMAKQNGDSLGLTNITFIQSDLFSALGRERFDCIVSNPPYIAASDPHLQDLTCEPQHALVAEDQGLALLKQLIIQAADFLNSGGLLILEHGYDQAIQLQEFSKMQILTWIETRDDYAGLPRVSIYRKMA